MNENIPAKSHRKGSGVTLTPCCVWMVDVCGLTRRVKHSTFEQEHGANMEVVGGSLLYYLYACAHYDITVTIDTGIAVTMDTGFSYQ